MANVQRKRSGPTDVVKGKIDAGVVAEIGDIVGYDGTYVKPASAYSDSQTEAFHDEFLGVLVGGATTGDETEDTPCLVETVGNFEFPLATALVAAKGLGQLIGTADAGSTLYDQVVDLTNTTNEAIGKLARPGVVGDTSVLVAIKSVVMHGGQQTFE